MNTTPHLLSGSGQIVLTRPPLVSFVLICQRCVCSVAWPDLWIRGLWGSRLVYNDYKSLTHLPQASASVFFIFYYSECFNGQNERVWYLPVNPFCGNLCAGHSFILPVQTCSDLVGLLESPCACLSSAPLNNQRTSSFVVKFIFFVYDVKISGYLRSWTVCLCSPFCMYYQIWLKSVILLT